jgi:asparagine synthase (glutamine-hydrolysing)
MTALRAYLNRAGLTAKERRRQGNYADAAPKGQSNERRRETMGPPRCPESAPGMIGAAKRALRRAYHRTGEQLLLPPLARKIRRDNLTYLSVAKLRSLHGELARILEQEVPGDIREFGVALGGSAIYLTLTAKDRNFHGYDVFGMIPPPTDQDGEDSKRRYQVISGGGSEGLGGQEYYGYRRDLYSEVSGRFAAYGAPADGGRVTLHKGLFEETLSLAPGERVALAHIDCDWYEPVRFCMDRIAAALSPGGAMIFDDYNDYEGCRKAVDEGLRADASLTMIRRAPHAVVRKA